MYVFTPEDGSDVRTFATLERAQAWQRTHAGRVTFQSEATALRAFMERNGGAMSPAMAAIFSRRIAKAEGR